ncbi:TonB-dependent receptor plug [Fibrisoma limi BUZ 3]|uniref:TonB-dependent receptor plug n=2 Tax=Fibrisoma limi TaxID=663275 RepID=I2GBF2_9BACT|nr:TonB-dependent receptor plug [Fibrisoma limi BUZ 3]
MSMTQVYSRRQRYVTLADSRLLRAGTYVALAFMLLLWSGVDSLAQTRKRITGIVTAAPNNEPLPGVSVVVKGSSIGANTDAKGAYSLEAPANATLVFSFIGYVKQEVATGNRTTVNVSMQEDVSNLKEVVVVGYGQIKRADLSSAQTSVTSADIQKTVNTTLEQALQGRSANVYVTQNTGQPGGGISVNIRGINTINGSNEPLYVIDGVQVQGAPGGSYGVTSSINPLAGLNPSDIESMEILQGPSATAIYGSRATNGVVLITTKRGKAGQTKINYNFLYTLQDTPKLLPTLNLREYAVMVNEYRQLSGQTPILEFQDPSLLGEGTNWQRELFRQAPLLKHQLSLSGGNDKTTYYLSGEYFNQQGVAVGSSFNRYSVRLNVDNQTRSWLKISSNLNLSKTEDRVTQTNNDLINLAIEQSPNIPLRNPDGSWGGPTNPQFAVNNPIAIASLIDNRVNRANILGGLTADINLFKGLVFRNSFNGSGQFSTNNTFTPTYQLGTIINNTASANKGSGNNYYWNLNQLLQYDTQFGKHSINAIASHEAQESTYEGLSAGIQGFVTNNIAELPLGDPKTATNSSYKGSWGMESYLARVNYTYNDRYIVQAAFRADGSPSFAPSKRWGYFPSVSAAWRISEEPFMKQIPQINELKLRFETGLTGNQGSTGYFSALQPVATQWGTGYLARNYANPEYQWESTMTYNLGFNLNMFSNRIQLEGDFYIKKTDNLIMNIPLPTYMGTSGSGSIGPPLVNIGALENRGYGITLNTVNIDRAGFKWTSNFNVSGFKNNLSKLYAETATLDRPYWFMENFLARSVVGQPAFQFFGYVKEGIFKSVEEINNSAIPAGNTVSPNSTWVGDIKYKDLNGDKIIDARDQTFIGNPWPKMTFGFTNNLSYRDFDLTVLLTSSYGNQIYNFVRFRNENPGRTNVGRGLLAGAANYARLTNDPTNPTLLNPDADRPRITGSDANGNANRATQDYVEDGSYIRVKNIQLGYNLPKSLVSRQKVVQGVRVTAGVQNAFTFTKYTGYDPEVGAFVGSGSNPAQSVIGVDYGRYPLTRMYTVSVGVDF